MRLITFAVLCCAGISTALAAPGALHLLQKPAMNKTEIVFSYAGDLWRVSREGGAATRLTSGPGFESDAAFSPDGKTLAFSGEYDGNVDVFTVPVTGGVPKRVTFHPAADRVVGWTPDGAHILFRSNRLSHSRYTQLFTVAAEGGLPEALPLPMGCMGAYSPDGKRMLYAPIDGGQFAPTFTNFVAWKRYRGGSASYLWLVNLADLTTVKVPRTDSNDIYPMWIGDKTYFLSDRNGPMTLFSYDPQSKKVSELIKNTGKDISAASAGPGGIVYEQFGADTHLRHSERQGARRQDRDCRRPHRSAPALPERVAGTAARGDLAHRRACAFRSPRRGADGSRREGRGAQLD
jgi:tricorn protease